MDSSKQMKEYFQKLHETLSKIDPEKINILAEKLLKHYQSESPVYIFGNGGSSSTASHTVADFNNGVSWGQKKRFRFQCLNDNTATLSALSNDQSYSDVFYSQLKDLLRPRDLVIAISCSGNSENVVKAIEYAKQVGADTVTLCGFDGGKLKRIDPENCIHVPISDMQIAEDCHVVILHMLMQMMGKQLHEES